MKKFFLLFLVSLLSTFSFAQAPAKWSVNGNATASGDFLGTTNNNPLIFYANNAEGMRLKPNGEFRINNLGGTGDNFVFSNSSGVLFTKPCSADTNKFMTEAGVFRTASSFTGWKFNGNNIHTINGSYVGIGTNNPQYQLDVNGDARFNGTLYSFGLVLATKMQADTVKSTSMISINNNLSFYSGLVNDIYTSSGDVRLQSRLGYGGNTILNAGNNGNVGIGVFAPQYKLDVNGDERVNGKMFIHRIVPLLGDSEIHFGDSSITLLPSVNAIHGSTSGNYRGFGLGWSTYSHGLFSTSIGHNVETDALAENAVVIGSGPANFNRLINTTKNSLIVGFNSTTPTLFVGPSSGVGTIGKVGIGTTSPRATFQVGNLGNSVTMGDAPLVGSTFSISYVGFNVARESQNLWTTANASGNNGGVVMLATMDGGLRFVGIRSTLSGSPQSFADATIQNNTRMYMRPDGRVEIGAHGINQNSFYDDATTLLTVEGRIMCKDLVVSKTGSGDWPDFVFDSSYVMMPLDTMADYLLKNKHLPLSEPTSFVDANGISVSETIKAQQQQTEEMMLYILQLNERLKALETENAELKAKGGK
jgi:hypothetical protein